MIDQFKFKTLTDIDALLNTCLIVSCQPVDNGPMDDDDTVVRYAKAVIAGGAEGLRIEGAARLAKVRQALPNALIIGIVKRDLNDSPVRITPYSLDVIHLANAGADIIAIDATHRSRPEPIIQLLAKIHQLGKISMADCSCEADAKFAFEAGVDIIGTTLSGYTGEETPELPDLPLLAALTKKYPRVMAEGRINTPALYAQAKKLGAWGITVGTAITRVEVITQGFSQALTKSY